MIKLIVTPYVGVWIETSRRFKVQCRLTSHPTWVCGLKLNINIIQKRDKVTPYVGVWIETAESESYRTESKSHPTWVCGLKLKLS